MLLVMIVPAVGLAIDVGVMYAVKSRAQAAADGAALSAARSLSRGLDLASQEDAARETAIRWFHANLPDNYFGVGVVADPTISFPSAPPRTIVVNVAARLQVQTYFSRILRVNHVTLDLSAQATRRDVNIVLVLDRSGSLYQSGSCEAVKVAALQFVNSFVNGRDRLGLVSFGTDYRVDFAPETNFASASPDNMVSMLNSLYCYGYTNAAAAYWTGYRQLVDIDDQGALNVILFFTDGMPNTITFGIAPDGTDNRLPVKTQTTPLSWSLAGYNIRNKSACRDSEGRTSSSPSWSPTPFTGVISYSAGIYKKDAPGFPASQAFDAQRIDSTQGNHGGCAFHAHFNDSWTIFYGGSPSRAIAGPGFLPVFDIAYLPEEDIFRNRTASAFGGGAALAAMRRYPNSGSWPAEYRNKIRVDDIATGSGLLGVSDTITAAGINALDYAAQRARADSVARDLDVVTYVIGLGNAPHGVDNMLLQRVANDRAADNFNSAHPAGVYLFAPTTAQLNQAFAQIASDVLRLSR
jgi:hypothetical protein